MHSKFVKSVVKSPEETDPTCLEGRGMMGKFSIPLAPTSKKLGWEKTYPAYPGGIEFWLDEPQVDGAAAAPPPLALSATRDSGGRPSESRSPRPPPPGGAISAWPGFQVYHQGAGRAWGPLARRRGSRLVAAACAGH